MDRNDSSQWIPTVATDSDGSRSRSASPGRHGDGIWPKTGTLTTCFQPKISTVASSTGALSCGHAQDQMERFLDKVISSGRCVEFSPISRVPTSRRLLSRKLQWIIWPKTRCWRCHFETNWTAETFGHLEDSRWSVWRHARFFFYSVVFCFISRPCLHCLVLFLSLKLNQRVV